MLRHLSQRSLRTLPRLLQTQLQPAGSSLPLCTGSWPAPADQPAARSRPAAATVDRTDADEHDQLDLPAASAGDRLVRQNRLDRLDRLRSLEPAGRADYQDTRDLPVASRQLKNDYRLKQFVQSEQDELQVALRNCRSVEELFAMVRANERHLYSEHIAAAFAGLFGLARLAGAGAPDRSRFVQAVVEQPDFKRLCSHAVQKLRYCQPSDVISLFKALTYLNVGSRTLLLNGVLQMIRFQINEFEADELVLVDYLLNLHRRESKEALRNPYLESLYLAVPIVFESKIRNKEIDFDNLDSLAKYFTLACMRRINGKYVNQLLLALKMQQQQPAFDSQLAATLLTRITNLPVHDDYNLDFDLVRQVCGICNQKLLEHLPLASQTARVRTYSQLGRIYSRILNRRLLFAIYNRELLDQTLQHLHGEFAQLRLDDAYQLIHNLSHLAHYDKPILERFYFLFLENYEHYINQNSIRPSGLIYSYFTPLRFDRFDLRHLFNLVLNPKKVAALRSEFDGMLSIARNLTVLGVYEPTELFDEFFRLLCPEKMVKDSQRKYLNKTLRILYIGMTSNENLPSALRAHLPKLKQLLEMTTGDESDLCLQVPPPAAFSLKRLLGAPRARERDVRSRLGHRLGQLVVWDTDREELVPLSEQAHDAQFLEDIQLPENQRLVHLLVGSDWNCKSPEMNRPILNFYINTLKPFNVTTVAVNLEKVAEMSDQDIHTLLVQRIRQQVKG